MTRATTGHPSHRYNARLRYSYFSSPLVWLTVLLIYSALSVWMLRRHAPTQSFTSTQSSLSHWQSDIDKKKTTASSPRNSSLTMEVHQPQQQQFPISQAIHKPMPNNTSVSPPRISSNNNPPANAFQHPPFSHQPVPIHNCQYERTVPAGNTTTTTQHTVRVPENLPSFIVIGVPKSGTTSLLTYFRDHPDIVQTNRQLRREAHFFDTAFGALFERGKKDGIVTRQRLLVNMEKGNWVTDAMRCYFLDQYLQLFNVDQIWNATNPHAANNGNLTTPLYTFEKTPSYFSSQSIPYRIRQTTPWSKIILILRNPVDRAYSQYKMTIRNAADFRTVSIEEMLRHEVSQMRSWNMTTAPLINETIPQDTNDSVSMDFSSWSESHTIPESHWTEELGAKSHKWDMHMLIRKSIYSIPLKWWLKHYQVDRDMLVIDYNDLNRDIVAVYHRILEFCNLPPDPATLRYNDTSMLSGGNISNYTVLKSRARSDNRADYRPLANSTRAYLRAFFRPYNQQLEELLGPKWKLEKLGW